MESWVVGYEGDEDVERHASDGGAAPRVQQTAPLRLRVVSDYI